jgi:hypothetical protein
MKIPVVRVVGDSLCVADGLAAAVHVIAMAALWMLSCILQCNMALVWQEIVVARKMHRPAICH